MSLELLREKFGYSGVTKEEDNREKIHEKLSTRFTYKKEVDNEEKIHEKLNGHFNPMGDIKSIKVQHQEQLDEKQKIIENLQTETSELTNEVVTLKKEKAVLLDNLNKSKWMEDKVHLTAKKLYEDKIKKMEFVDSTKLIPLLISVSRKKQGNTKLNWGNWLKISENKYLFQINESLAKRVFEDTIALIDRNVSYINEKRRTYGGDVAKNYFLSFTGDTNHPNPRADLVRTDFTPNDPTNKGFAEGSGRISLAKSGFTISYWYRPDETANDAFAMGWKRENTARFSFGMRNAARPYFSIGSNTFGTYGSHNAWYNMFNNSGNTDFTDKYIDENDNLIADGSNWYHIAITYVGQEPGGVANNETDQYRRIYFNGKQIYGQNDEAIGTAYNDWHNVDRTGLISWPEGNQDARMPRGFAFGMRTVKGTGTKDGIVKSKYNNGHACGLDDVAIYNELKDNDWVSGVYSGGTDYNHKDSGGDGLVAYWRFNERSGATVKDLGPYGYHGTLTNAAVGEGDDITVQTAIGNIAEGTPTWNELGSYE